MAKLEKVFFAIGFALLALWGTATFHRFAFSRAAIAKFGANEVTKANGSLPAAHDSASRSGAGLRSWPSKRVHGYKDSLLEMVDAPLALLRIPKIHLEVPVFDGTDGVNLNRGVGRITGTAQVGADGNLGIAGHRDGFFRGLKKLTKGDVIELVGPFQIDFYVIDRVQITKPEDVSVLKPTPTPTLTLVTCFPFHFVGSAPQRYIVRASLRSSRPSSEAASPDLISVDEKPNYKEN